MKSKILLSIAFLSVANIAAAACNNDLDCGFGNKCIKASGDINITGTCVVPTDQFGNRTYNYSTPSPQPKITEGCMFDNDCSLGSSCMKRSGQIYGICLR